ncbi:uncharacterized protein LOC144919389 [Branchiostoma floridae x Branchiostoma belcheri]
MTMSVTMKTALLLTLLVLLSLHEAESKKSRRKIGFGLGRRRSASSSYPKQKQWSSWSSSSSNSGYPKQQQWSSWGNTGGSSYGNTGGSSYGNTGGSWGNTGGSSYGNTGGSWGNQNSGSSWNNRGSSGSSWGSTSSSRSRKRWGSSTVATAAIAGLAGLYGGHVLTSMAYNSMGPRYDYNYGYNNYRPYYQSSSCRAGQCEVRFTVNDTVIPPPRDPTKTNVTIPPYAELVFLCRNGGTCDKSHVCYNNVYLYNNKLFRDYPRITAASSTSTSTSTSTTTQVAAGPSRASVRNNVTAVNVTAAPPPVTRNIAKRQAPIPQPEMVQICRASDAAGTAAYALVVTVAFFFAMVAP